MEDSEALTIVPTLIPFVLVVFAITLGVVLINFQFQKRLHRQQLEKERLRNDHQQSLLKASVEIQEEERKRIAQDIHDELGAVLSISKMQLSHYEKLETLDPKKLKETRRNLESALKSVRRISHDLTPLNLEKFGLKRAILSLVQPLNDAGIKTVTKLNLEEGSISWTLQLDIYRIYSELINNTVKHANASEIIIELVQNETHINCNYRDNGKGIENTPQTAGIGLSGIDKRIKLHQGSFDYGNGKENGFFAKFQLSLNES